MQKKFLSDKNLIKIIQIFEIHLHENDFKIKILKKNKNIIYYCFRKR